MHSALILKEKKLLFVDEIKKTGLASRQVEVAGYEPIPCPFAIQDYIN